MTEHVPNESSIENPRSTLEKHTSETVINSTREYTKEGPIETVPPALLESIRGMDSATFRRFYEKEFASDTSNGWPQELIEATIERLAEELEHEHQKEREYEERKRKYEEEMLRAGKEGRPLPPPFAER